MNRFYKYIPLLLFTVLLSACGGGGSSAPSGGQSPPPAAAAPATWYFPEGSSLSSAQATTLLDTNQLYLTARSADNSVGIRGEVTVDPAVFRTDAGDPFAANPAGLPVTYAALMGGDQVRPRNVITKAGGYGSVTLDPVTRRLSGFIVTSGISGSAARIHDGLPGSAGSSVVSLTGGPVVWTVPAGTSLTDAQIARLAAGAFYLTVASSSFPGGELRGQLNQQLRMASLQGANEVPPVVTTATGTGYLALNPSTLQFSGYVRFSGLGSPVRSAVVHIGTSGTVGPGIIILTDSGNGVWSIPPNTVLSGAQVANFNDGELYFNIHTQNNLGGELRGQLLPATVKVGSATLNGSKQVPAVATTASGSALLAWNPVTGQVSGSVTTDGINGANVTVSPGTPATTGTALLTLTTVSPVTVAPLPGISFALDIQPIFNARCISLFCHASGGLGPMSLEAGSSYTNLAPLVVPGSSATSFLMQRLTSGTVNLPQMPLNRPPLPATELDLFRSWIDSGAYNN